MTAPAAPDPHTLAQAQGGDEAAFRALLAPHERELRAYCYRMAGSVADADDMMQDARVRIWSGLSSFGGRASLRTWLFKVTANACLDALKSQGAKKRAQDLGPPLDIAAVERGAFPAVDGGAGALRFVEPCPPSLYFDDGASPEDRARAQESVALAFLAALQLLPARQRAALIACDVLGFSVQECAGLIEGTEVAVQSALQRARESIASRAPTWRTPTARQKERDAFLASYLAAWNRADGKALVALLADDVEMAMPPLPYWIRGARAVAAALDAMVFAPTGRDAFRAITLEANARPALALYRRAPAGGAYERYALHVLDVDVDTAADHTQLRSFTAFLDTRVFDAFELPLTL